MCGAEPPHKVKVNIKTPYPAVFDPTAPNGRLFSNSAPPPPLEGGH
ncbi:MAG: hypothetical protein LBH93_07625 [Chitinispirillales bacterium]|nr:hypothetical protein [Chitinispirillales bacterium]